MVEPPDPPAAIPERLGDFRLLERVGAGSMGVVYRALQVSLRREVALKLILPEQLYFPEARERFRREIEAVSRLRHVGIVHVHTVGEEGGLPYFAMELVEGASLAAVVEHLRGQRAQTLSGADLAAAIQARTRLFGAPPPISASDEAFAGTWVQSCCRVVLQVAEALHHAHEPAPRSPASPAPPGRKREHALSHPAPAPPRVRCPSRSAPHCTGAVSNRRPPRARAGDSENGF